MRSIRRGDRGDEVRDVQARLLALGYVIRQSELEEDRFEGSTDTAVRAFQQDRGLLVDGLVGPQAWEELVEAGYALGDRVLYLRHPPFRGDDVRALQARLNTLGFDPGREDGIFGRQTEVAMRDFQRNVGLPPDGIVGSTSLQALERLRASVPGPGRTMVRETEDLRLAGSLEGKVVAIDPAHGPGDPGEVGPGGSVESEITYAIAERLAEALEGRGAKPVLLREPGGDPPVAARIDRATASGADLLLSIHLNHHGDPTAEGVAAYYFGRLGAVSVAGRALAEVLLERITSRLGLRDGRAHPKAFPLLRETPMPAVHLEPGFISNPREERLLNEGRFHHDLAEAIVEALERYFAGLAPSD
ncbi:MAG TPA: N-acetylmuramoyl-L-alanine amidase [Actinomycetota bacterium]